MNCIRCGIEIHGSIKKKYCTDCKIIIKRERARINAKIRYQNSTKTIDCIKCGKTVKKTKHNQKYCKDCGQRTGLGTGTGFTTDGNGYVRIFKPDHPMAGNRGYIYYHRYVMEQHLGRYLVTNEEIHHKDLNKKNNNIENLQIMTAKDHKKLHDYLNNQDKPKKYCLTCGELLFKGQEKYCSRACVPTRVKWASKEELQEDININKMTWVAIGKKYGVSDNAIKKWAKKYNIIKNKPIIMIKTPNDSKYKKKLTEQKVF